MSYLLVNLRLRAKKELKLDFATESNTFCRAIHALNSQNKICTHIPLHGKINYVKIRKMNDKTKIVSFSFLQNDLKYAPF